MHYNIELVLHTSSLLDFFHWIQSEPTGIQQNVKLSAFFPTLNGISWKGKNIIHESWASARGQFLQEIDIPNYLDVINF